MCPYKVTYSKKLGELMERGGKPSIMSQAKI